MAAEVTDQFYYRGGGVPRDYFCAHCKAQGVRLYRDYGGCHPGDLTCTRCTEKRQKRTLDPNHPHTIGWKCAAIPSEDGIGYWGYTSVPDDGVSWWNALPISP